MINLIGKIIVFSIFIIILGMLHIVALGFGGKSGLVGAIMVDLLILGSFLMYS